MIDKELLAKKYAEENNSAYVNDYYGFLAGYEVGQSNMKEDIKKLVYQFKGEELPNAEEPFDCQAEIWAGMKNFIVWLESR